MQPRHRFDPKRMDAEKKGRKKGNEHPPGHLIDQNTDQNTAQYMPENIRRMIYGRIQARQGIFYGKRQGDQRGVVQKMGGSKNGYHLLQIQGIHHFVTMKNPVVVDVHETVVESRLVNFCYHS